MSRASLTEVVTTVYSSKLFHNRVGGKSRGKYKINNLPQNTPQHSKSNLLIEVSIGLDSGILDKVLPAEDCHRADAGGNDEVPLDLVGQQPPHHRLGQRHGEVGSGDTNTTPSELSNFR